MGRLPGMYEDRGSKLFGVSHPERFISIFTHGHSPLSHCHAAHNFGTGDSNLGVYCLDTLLVQSFSAFSCLYLGELLAHLGDYNTAPWGGWLQTIYLSRLGRPRWEWRHHAILMGIPFAWWMISHSQVKRGQESPLGVSFIKIMIPLGRTLACEMLHL